MAAWLSAAQRRCGNGNQVTALEAWDVGRGMWNTINFNSVALGPFDLIAVLRRLFILLGSPKHQNINYSSRTPIPYVTS